MTVADKELRLIVPADFREPKQVNTWRVYPSDDGHFVIELGYRQAPGEIQVVSRVILEAKALRPLLVSVLSVGLRYEQEYQRDLGLGSQTRNEPATTRE